MTVDLLDWKRTSAYTLAMKQITTPENLAEPFKPRLPWLTGDLQTVRNLLIGRPADLSAWPCRRVELDLDDGTGDHLLGSFHPAASASGPLAVLIHGLTGSQDSHYLRATARFLLTQGFAVLRLNLRGAGPGRALARQQYHAGRSADIDGALRAFQALEPKAFETGLFLVGFSLGANVLLKFLAEEGSEWSVTAAATVSAPIDLRAGQQCLMKPRNRVYHYWLLRNMKRELLSSPGGLDGHRLQVLEAVRDIYDFDDRIVAPANGFDGALDYYTRCSAVVFLPSIKTPTLLVQAVDDPWIPVESYRYVDWQAYPNLRLLLADGGGHVGFHAAQALVPWHDQKISAFFKQLRG